MDTIQENRSLPLFVTLCLLTAGGAAIAMPAGAQSGAADDLGFGMPLSDLDEQRDRGLDPDYASFWVGPWTVDGDWSAVERRLERAEAAGVTPVIQFFYWGNDISKDCLENGCYSELHDTHKDQETWRQAASRLGQEIDEHLQDQQAIVVLETEFNKGNVDTYEPLDQDLSEVAGTIQHGAPNARVALGLGNWGHHAWDTWDRAAGTADLVSIQGMRGSTQDSRETYRSLVDQTKQGIERADALFGGPVILSDLALSSYPEPDYAQEQADELAELFDRSEELAQAGLVGVVYRTFRDDPNAMTAEYYGEAEKHWGLVRDDGSEKPALDVWIDGVQGGSSGGSSSGGSSSSSGVAVGSSGTTSLEAESFTTRSEGARQDDGSASANERWNLWTDGHLTEQLDVADAGSYDLSILAKGHELDSVAPHMVAEVDGRAVLETDPSAGDWSEHATTVDLSEGSHELSIRFTNDDLTEDGDRNLLLDRVQISPR